MPQVIAAMIGRRLDDVFPPRPADAALGPVVLEVSALRQATQFGPLSFGARAGEILGFAGLEGAGVDELFRALFGLDPTTGGQILVRGKPQPLTTPLAAIRNRWALIPASRREQGLMMDYSIARNATLLILEKLRTWLGLIDHQAVHQTTFESIRRFGIACANQDQKVVLLSGGNQQKVLLAKWLATGPDLLILNDPTRGVDVGAKQEIHELCRRLASHGMTILLTSSEADEILGLADRVLVLVKGRIAREFRRGEATKGALLHAMTGAAPLA